jgi:hypothetical protein
MANEDVKPTLKRQLAEALSTGKYRKARRIAESLLLWDDFGSSDLFDRVRPSSNDGPGWTTLSPPSVPSDRRHGAQWPVWRTQQELDLLRQEARLRLAANSYAKGLLRNLTNNVIGKGCSYVAVPIVKKGEEATEEQQALASDVQEVIDAFLSKNNWNGGTHYSDSGVIVNTREKEIYRRVKGDDGECFLRFHREEDGTITIRFIEPEQVRDSGGLVSEGWSYGIQHQMQPYEDVETPLKYKVFWPDAAAPGGEADKSVGGTYDEIDAGEVLHIKGPDTPATVKRGLSSFIFDVGRALDRASKLQRNASLGAAYRAATGEIWQHHVGTQQQLQSLAESLGEVVTNPSVNGGLETVERIRAPAVRRIPDGQEMVPLPPDQSESYLQAGQGDLRQAASAFCAPEFWMAETSSGNYSNLESAAAPAVREGQSEQEYFKSAFARCIWKAIMWAVECDLLPAGIERKIKIQVEAPAVLHRDEDKKAQQDQVYNQLRVKSPQTIAAEMGLDYEVEQAQIQRHEDRWGGPLDELEQADDEHPGGEGPLAKAGGKQPGRNGQAKPMRETRDASGHEHDNKGLFTGSGGGAAHEKLKAAQAAHQKAKQEHMQARKEAYNEAKDYAKAHADAMQRHSDKITNLVNSLDTGSEDAEVSDIFTNMDYAQSQLADGQSFALQKDAVDSLYHGARMYIASNAPDEFKQGAKQLLKAVKDAKQSINGYIEARKMMKSIKSGELIEGLVQEGQEPVNLDERIPIKKAMNGQAA